MNKIKRKGKYEPGKFDLSVKRTRSGFGLVTNQIIPKGVCIIEYKGRTISKEEEYSINSKYLFEIHSRKTIDGSIRSNVARYINHSCRPNCEVEIKKGKVFIMSKKNIDKGTELNYDYGKEYWKEYIQPRGCRCERCLKIT
jgi:uncharacterized protein